MRILNAPNGRVGGGLVGIGGRGAAQQRTVRGNCHDET
jgi:hypothetical protein